MKILLQDLSNSLYVKRFGKRTEDSGKALAFPHTLAAVRYQSAHPMENLQIVLCWDDREEDLKKNSAPASRNR